jgi:hypothetical protein
MIHNLDNSLHGIGRDSDHQHVTVNDDILYELDKNIPLT